MNLTPREIEIARLVGEGKREPEIARTLNIGRWEVVRHLKYARLKTGAQNTAHLMALAYPILFGGEREPGQGN